MAEGPEELAAHRPRPRPSPAAITDPPVERRVQLIDEPADHATTRVFAQATVLGAARTPVNGRAAWRAARAARAGHPVARVEAPHGAQVMTAAGSAIVTAARVGRLLGRTGWRAAKQLPGVDAVEHQAHKMRHAAALEVMKLLEIPQPVHPTTLEEQRAAGLVQYAGNDPEPLRSAMTELLERSSDPDRTRSRDYLFGTIVSQLVPDEARILAQLAPGESYAFVDVVAKHIGRTATRTVLTNISTVGLAAGLAEPANTPTYLKRLRSFGLVEVAGVADDGGRLADQFDQLANDPAVQRARSDIERSKGGSARTIRRTLRLSAFGIEFWTACAPSRGALARQSD